MKLPPLSSVPKKVGGRVVRPLSRAGAKIHGVGTSRTTDREHPDNGRPAALAVAVGNFAMLKSVRGYVDSARQGERAQSLLVALGGMALAGAAMGGLGEAATTAGAFFVPLYRGRGDARQAGEAAAKDAAVGLAAGALGGLVGGLAAFAVAARGKKSPGVQAAMVGSVGFMIGKSLIHERLVKPRREPKP